MSTSSPTVHVCIATGQNAANLIPLLQLDAREVWILQTPEMKDSAGHLQTALRHPERKVRTIPFDDHNPEAIRRSAGEVANQLQDREVVLHVTGGTKLMVLALYEELSVVEAGGKLEPLYAETRRQKLDWLGKAPRSEPMADVLDLQALLLVQGYRIEGDNRHAEAQKLAQTRAALTRDLGENAALDTRAKGALAGLASRAAAEKAARDLTQQFNYPPGARFADFLRKAQGAGLLQWDEDITVNFASAETARYLSGGWLEEFVLLKLTGGLVAPGRFSTNLNVVSVDNGVRNEIDAMLVHRNRALLIECKTGQQAKAQEALYKLAQVRQRLGGTFASALYLSAQTVNDADLARAEEYGIDVLQGDQIAQLVRWLKNWLAR